MGYCCQTSLQPTAPFGITPLDRSKDDALRSPPWTSATRRTEGYRFAGILAPLLTALVAFPVLSWHAAPTGTFHDSGEFALAAASAGVTHPPGSPTWTILASGFLRLFPFSDSARGTNVFAALCGSVTLGLLSAVARLWCLAAFRPQRPWISNSAGIAAALVLCILVLWAVLLVGFAFAGVGLAGLARRQRTFLGWTAAATVPYAAGMFVAHMRPILTSNPSALPRWTRSGPRERASSSSSTPPARRRPGA